jgi:hypothetical protein
MYHVKQQFNNSDQPTLHYDKRGRHDAEFLKAVKRAKWELLPQQFLFSSLRELYRRTRKSAKENEVWAT